MTSAKLQCDAASLGQLDADLMAGSLVVLGEGSARIRALPIL